VSQVTTIFNAMVALCSTELGGTYRRLANAYSPAANSETALAKGYGVTLGPAQNTNRYLGSLATMSREFGVVLTKHVVANEGDATGLATLEKNLMEDALLIVKAIEEDASLGGTAEKAAFVSDDGIGFVEPKDEDQPGHFVCRLTFEIEYRESL
jgi:hypothetical protein